MAATPPLRTVVHTPSTPLHGARYDSYERCPARNNTRRSTQHSKRAAQTPPPPSFNFTTQIISSSDTRDVLKRRHIAHTYSPPSSTNTSPQKKLLRSRKAVDSAKMDGTNPSFGSTSFQFSQDATSNSSLHIPTPNIAPKMLPTPAKTPRKKTVHPTTIANAARVLFPARPDTVEEAMPTPRKRRKPVGSLFDSSREEGDTIVERRISIYTDSKERVPEVDTSEENPFYGNPTNSRTDKELDNVKGSKKKASKTKSVFAKEKQLDDGIDHDKGMLYVFRGKTVYHQFPDEPDCSPGSPLGKSTGLGEEDSPPHHFTRSSVKPRLLWPTTASQQEKKIVEDEEATTEIEDIPPTDGDMTDLTHETEDEVLSTPVKPSYMVPTTPPSTVRATRSAARKAIFTTTPLEPVKEVCSSGHPLGKRNSPFNSWHRAKVTALEAKKGKKRQGEVLDIDGGGKKMKGKVVEDEA